MYKNTLLELDGSKFRAEKNSIGFVYIPKSISDFLDKTNTSMVLVGQKGIGKSILLSYKKYNDTLRTEETKTFIFPKASGIEEINFDGEMGVRHLTPFSVEDWEKIFVISIQYYLFCQLKDVIIDNGFLSEENFKNLEIHNFLNPHKLDVTILQFGDILDKAIINKINNREIRSFQSQARNILIGGIVEKNKNNIFYYLDGLDQAIYKAIHRTEKAELNIFSEVDNILKFENSFDEKNTDKQNDRETNKVHLWIKAQLGFLKALHYLNEFNRSNFKIYGSIRYEAFIMMDHYNLKNLPQLKSACEIISYSDDELIKIFESLLKAADIEMSDFKRFGIDDLIHNKVKDRSYNKESIQKHILRHTLRNPREITYQIRAIKELFDSDRLIPGDSVKNTESLKEKLSGTIKEIKKDFETETLPAFPSKGLESLVEEFQKNYIPLNKVTEEHKKTITVLYRLGLIGVLKREKDNLFKQHFLEKNIYFLNSSQKLPDSPYYLLHPVLDPLLFDNYGHEKFYYPYSIIGHGLPFLCLREKEYYIPANLFKDNLKNDPKKIKSLFIKFWEGETSLERYIDIVTRFNMDWGQRILSCYFFESEPPEDIRKTFTDELGDGNFLTLDTKKMSIDTLRKNYKLRMIVALGLPCKIFGESDVNSLYEESYYRFRQRSFFSNIRNSKLEVEKVKEFLSKFELNCIHDSLDNFKKNFASRIEASNEMKDRFTKLIEIFPSYP